MKRFFAIALMLAIFIHVPLSVAAENITLTNPLCLQEGGTCINSFQSLIETVTNWIFSIIGALAVLMFIISGIYFVISAGSQDKVKRAKDIAIYAAVGAGIAIAGKSLIEVVKAVIGVK